MKKINIAIDGYSGCGKSSTAKMLAREMGYTYIDSGAMYRAVTLYFIKNHVSITNPKSIEKALNNIDIRFVYDEETGSQQTYLNGLNVEEEIRSMEVSQGVSEVSAIHEVRSALVAQQRKLGKGKGIVMDGRDIGTVVFPDAELKIFMQADIDVRSERRQKELMEKDILVNFEDVKKNLLERDRIDTSRKDSPLRKADDATVIDSTQVTLEEQVQEALNLALGKVFEDKKEIQTDGNYH